MQKPSVPKGTRDFNPTEMARRNFIFSTIRKYFRLYGFEQIETPAMENITTLMGKYGEEGDRLIFKILNSGLNESKDKHRLISEFESLLSSPRSSEFITEKALRYDLTVPFARYVVQHQHEINFPFKRFQIQPVWRADRPQKGRYREFYQCDADVIGSDSLLNEVELISLMQNVYDELQLPVLIKINNRKVLSGIAEKMEAPEKLTDITTAIDKLDKIGEEGVMKEMIERGISEDSILKFKPILKISGENSSRLIELENFMADSPMGLKGLQEIRFVLEAVKNTAHTQIEIDLTLARGIHYYTGSIFEVKSNKGEFKSSILGGGRYDDLTGVFGLKGMSGVGISFGIDRMYDVMLENGLFTDDKISQDKTKVLFANFGAAEEKKCLDLAAALRRNGISCEVYPSATKKIQKQFEYAEKKGIQFMVFIGSDELSSDTFPVKDIINGKQEKFSISDFQDFLLK